MSLDVPMEKLVDLIRCGFRPVANVGIDISQPGLKQGPDSLFIELPEAPGQMAETCECVAMNLIIRAAAKLDADSLDQVEVQIRKSDGNGH